MSIVTQTTRLIEPSTGDYPVYLSQMGSRLVGSFPPTVDSELLAEFGYYPVNDVDVPVGDVVTEGAPVQGEDGQWYRNWIVREYTPEEKAAMLIQAKDTAFYQIEQKRIQSFRHGFPYLFTSVDQIYHVQLREFDLISLIARRTIALEKKAADQPFPVTVRVQEDVSVQLDRDEIIQLAETAMYQVETTLAKVWAIVDGIKNATTIEEIPAIPDELFELL